MTTIDNLRKAAKRWLKSLREGDADARARLARVHPGATEHASRIPVCQTSCSIRACSLGLLIADESAWPILIRTSRWPLGASSQISDGIGCQCSSSSTACQCLTNENWRFIGCSMGSFEE